MLKKENCYDFKKELLEIHKPNRRNPNRRPKETEYWLSDGLCLLLPTPKSEVIYTAAQDFCDYLLTSMQISARLSYKAEADTELLRIVLNQDLGEAAGTMGYRITTGSNGILLEGYDENGVAQGLYFLEDLMNLAEAPAVAYGTVARKAMFSPRFTQSPFGMFEYNDAALAHMAHLGYDAISLWLKNSTTTLGGRYIDVPLLCQRAARFGIKIYVDLYAPNTVHPSDPEAPSFYDSIYGQLFRDCPDIAGLGLLGEATHFNSRDPKAGKAPLSENHNENIPTGKYSPGWWPCSDYPEWVELIKNTVRRVKPSAEIIFCTYNWGFAPEADRLNLINHLPTDITLMPTWDMFQQIPCGASVEDVVDYSLAFVGPGDYFKSEAIAAKRRGIRLYGEVNSAGRTWDYGTVPYEPMPYQWIKRYEAMQKAHEEWGLCGILECIHYGFHPSLISDLEKWAFFTPSYPLDEVLHKLLVRDFGENADKADKALQLFSEAITYYPPTNEDQYGAFRLGPSYPLWLDSRYLPGDGKMPSPPYAMFGNCIYRGRYTEDVSGFNSLPGNRIYDELRAIEKMDALICEGIKCLKMAKNPNESLQKLCNLAEFIHCSNVTALHTKQHYILKQRLSVIGSQTEAAGLLDEIEAILVAERENVLAAIPIVQADSRLGWEPSMEYVTDENALQWKLRQLSYEMTYTLPRFRQANALTL